MTSRAVFDECAIFAFLVAVRLNTRKLDLSDDGHVELNNNNLSAIAPALANSQITDIE